MATITYDNEADAMSITLQNGRVAQTFDWGDGVLVDYDQMGKVLSVEIIGLKKRI